MKVENHGNDTIKMELNYDEIAKIAFSVNDKANFTNNDELKEMANQLLNPVVVKGEKTNV